MPCTEPAVTRPGSGFAVPAARSFGFPGRRPERVLAVRWRWFDGVGSMTWFDGGNMLGGAAFWAPDARPATPTLRPMSAPSVWVTTLGCSKNQVDSEKLSALLTESGYLDASSPEDADIVMVNTCAFIEDARRESVDTILEMDGAKRGDAKLVVIGCMAQRFGAEIADALPEVDDIVGLDRYGELVGRLDTLTGWAPVEVSAVRARRSKLDILDLTARPAPSVPYAYVKIAEGCDKTCAFCAIPLIRGAQRSRRPTDIRDEITGLCANGVAEVVLVAQDLAAYGRDIDAPRTQRPGIVDLLRFIGDVDGLRRIRLLYLYPTEIRPALIEEMAGNPLVVPYFDLSLQHAAGNLLRSMRRPGSTERHLELIEAIRRAAPDAALRSSFVVGYPGESDADVDELAAFLHAAQLDWAGFFPYSPEAGTAAVELEGRIDPVEIGRRVRELSAIQDDITASHNARQVGAIHEVLIDQVEDGVAVGRSYREAPDIDGMIAVDRGVPGEWVMARIDAAYGADLSASVVDG
jgi:ribosomal protein S12 methylthiotransferase RimO